MFRLLLLVVQFSFSVDGRPFKIFREEDNCHRKTFVDFVTNISSIVSLTVESVGGKLEVEVGG